MRLVDGPFRRFAGEWRFVPLGRAPARIEFSLRYEFASRALGRLLAPLFDRIADSMVDAFVRRAEQVYARLIEVVYALPERAERCTLELPAGATARAARSRLLERGFDLEVHAVGVFGKRVPLDQAVARRRPCRDLPPARRRSEGSAPQARALGLLGNADSVAPVLDRWRALAVSCAICASSR